MEIRQVMATKLFSLSPLVSGCLRDMWKLYKHFHAKRCMAEDLKGPDTVDKEKVMKFA